MPIFSGHKPFWSFAAAVFGVHSLLMAVPPLNSDEAFIWNWARHLALGYYSHPPMSAWAVALVTSIAGTSAYTVRLTGLLFHLGTLGMLYLLALELSPRRRIALTACGLYALMPISLALGTMVSSDMGLIFFWALALYLCKKAVIDRRMVFWYAAGAAAGAMMLSKFFAVLFFPGLLLFLALHPAHRGQLARKEPWLASLIALGVFSPFLYWNATHDWLTFQFNLVNRQASSGFAWAKPLKFIGGQLLAASPVLMVVIVLALVAYTVPNLRRIRLLKRSPNFPAYSTASPTARVDDTLLYYALMTATPLIVLAIVGLRTNVGAHWAGVVFPSASILATAWLFRAEGKTLAGERPPLLAHVRTAKWCVGGLLAISLPVYVVLLQPRVLPDSLFLYDEARNEQQEAAKYYGWKEAGVRIAELRSRYAGLEGGLFLSTRDYSDASLFDFYTPGGADFVLMGYSTREFHGKEFLYWGRPLKKRGANTIFVLDTPIFPDSLHRIGPHFQSVEGLETLEIRDDEGRLLRRFFFALGRNYLANEPDLLSRW